MDEATPARESVNSPEQGYRAANDAVGLIDRSDRVRLSISGPDRAKFLHNLTTNEVKKLAPFQGREAFVTSPQGKTLAFISIHALDDRLLVRSDRAAFAELLPHFQKYGLFDEITIEDESSPTFEIHVTGPRVERLFSALSGGAPPSSEYGVVAFKQGDLPILAIRESPSGRPGLTFIGPTEVRDALRKRLFEIGSDLGLVALDPETFDTLRIEAGTPIFGRDVTSKNLPQELGRDDRAISFVKGCYLGQETVARIDALGHVNQMLRGFRAVSPTARLEPGHSLKHEGKQVGTLTSTSFSPGWNQWIALGFLRESARSSQATLEVIDADENQVGQVVVRDLSTLPPLMGEETRG